MQTAAEKILNEVFGYDSFRGNQKAIIENTIAGGDSLVLMPTGGGKSLCYQIPAIVRPGVGIVVSPLIALMQDQVEALLQLGVRAGFLNSSLNSQDAFEIQRRAVNGELDLLYVAPERLMMEGFQNFLCNFRIALFAIDEAHCVSQWGHDFRPEYLQMSVLAERFPNVPRIALTATADSVTRKEIVHKLRLENAGQFVSSFDRPNIFYKIVLKNRPKKQLIDFLENGHRTHSGIVYCLSRKKVDSTAEWLAEEGYRALPYHAGMTTEKRAENQRMFLMEEGVIIVATIAFGMGIDKPDVRFVAHLDLPKTLEAYYQETGRAGRDGKPSDAWMAYNFADVVMLRQMIEGSEGSPEFKRVQQQKLNAMLGFCEITGCRRQALLHYFGENLEEPCGHCDTCQEEIPTWDGTVAAQKALSCMYRTGQRFGAGYLIDVLLGKEDDRIRRFGHQNVSTYGIGKEHTESEWKSVYRQLVAGGYINVSSENMGGFLLNEAATPILRGEKKVFFRQDAREKTRTRSKSARASGELKGRLTTMLEEPVPDDPKSLRLLKALREYRTTLSKKKKIPPFVIFHDATLHDLVRKKPKDTAGLLEINGIGKKKAQQYGNDILKVIRGEGEAITPSESPKKKKKSAKKINQPPPPDHDPEKVKKERAEKWSDSWEPADEKTKNFVHDKVTSLGSLKAVTEFYNNDSLIARYARRIAFKRYAEEGETA